MEMLKVLSVETDSPASKAGMAVGDFIASIDVKPIRTQTEFDEAVTCYTFGKSIASVEVWANGVDVTGKVGVSYAAGDRSRSAGELAGAGDDLNQ